MNPFTIRIFVPKGESEGVRIIDRLSSTGKFFAFPRESWDEVKNRPELTGSGIYILTGYNDSSGDQNDLPVVYIGQADTVRNRIENHIRGKDFWDRAVVFVSANMNSTHAKWLEYALVKRVFEANRSNVENGNNPNEPTISESEKAEMEVFLKEIYETLPLVGLKAFEIPKAIKVEQKVADDPIADIKDTIIVPAKEDGFKKVFIGEDAWYAIRIGGGRLNSIKYIAAYRSAPISAVTHYAEVDKIEPYGEDGKYKLFFKDKAVELEQPIENDLPQGSMQGIRYVNFDKLSKAVKMSELN